MSKSTELAIVPPAETALAVFSAENGLDPYLDNVRQVIDDFLADAPDIKTKKGQDAYRSMAANVAGFKNTIEKLGKEQAAIQKEIPKKIDAERRRVWDKLELWQAEVRRPLTEWEAAEAARVERHNTGIQAIKDSGPAEGATAELLAQQITALELVAIDESWQEFEAEAARAKDQTLQSLRAALAIRQKHEAELAEIAKFAAEKAARDQAERDAEIARQAAERATREAAAQAQAERDAAAQREQALKDQAAQVQRQAEQDRLNAEAAAERQRLQLELQAEQARNQAAQAERDRIAAEQQAERDRLAAIERQAQAVEAAKQAEIRRQADEAAEADRQAKAREADVAHKAEVLTSIKEVFMKAGITEEQARAVINLIRKGEAPNVSITY